MQRTVHPNSKKMKKILSIDDQKDNLTTTKAVIESNIPNCKVLFAQSGKQGIEIAQKEQPDSILLDIIMPEMDGYEVCQKLKSDDLTKHIPVIMLTASKTDSKSRVKGLDSGADAFLSKPIDAVELSAQIKVMLRIKDAEDKLRLENEYLEELVLERTSELKLSEEKFKTLVVHTNIIPWRFDLNKNKFTYIGKQVEKILGYPSKSWTNIESWANRIHIDDRKTATEYCQSSTERAENHEFEYRCIAASGEIIWIKDIVSVRTDEKGVPFELIGYMINITERKLAEEKQQSSIARLNAVFQSAHDIIMFSLDKEYNYVAFNEKHKSEMKKVYDVNIEEGLNILKLINIPEIKSILENNFKRVLNGECFEEIRVQPGMNIYYQFFWNPVVKHDGELIGISCLVFDITKQKIAENLRSAQLRIIEYAADHTILELLQKVLDEAEVLTSSEVGFYHFVEDDQQSVNLQTWSTNTLKNMCKVDGEDRHYPISQAGIWVESIHQKKPVIHNDYESLEHKKGLPAGHAPIIRELVVPVLRGEKILSVLGVGNKSTNYNEEDVNTVQQLANVAWETVERKKTEEALKHNESLLSKIAENYPNSYISIIDKDFKTGFISGQEFKNQNLDPNQFIGLSVKEVFNEKESIVKAYYEKTFEGEEQSFELFINEQNQLYRTIPLKSENGEIKRILVVAENITERKQAENALLKSETQYRTLFENAGDGIIIIDEKGRTTAVNRSFADMHGYELDEMNKTNVRELGTPETNKLIPERIKRVLNGELLLFTIEHYHKKGHLITLEINACLIDVDGKKNIVAFHRDVTERVQAEIELRQSEERFKNLFNSLGDAVYVAKVGGPDKGRILEVNPSAIRQTGYSRDELLKMNIIQDLFIAGSEDIQTDDWEKKLINGETVTTIEKKRRKDGTEFWTEVIVTPIEYKGQIASLSINHDITGLKQAEKDLTETMSLLQATLESTADGILNVDLEGKIIDFNEKFIEIWKLNTDIIPQGRTKDLVAPENAAYAMKHIIGQLANPEAFIAKVQELYSKPEEESYDTLKFKDGRILERYSKPQYINEKPVGRVWSFRDITERIKAEEELKKHREHLEELVMERTAELEEKNTELERFNDLFIGREFRIKELRDKVKELEAKMDNIAEE